MSIEIVHDGSPAWEVGENCCFCRVATKHWSIYKDVAVCETCALLHSTEEIPDKKDWIASERAKRKSFI